MFLSWPVLPAVDFPGFPGTASPRSRGWKSFSVRCWDKSICSQSLGKTDQSHQETPGMRTKGGIFIPNNRSTPEKGKFPAGNAGDTGSPSSFTCFNPFFLINEWCGQKQKCPAGNAGGLGSPSQFTDFYDFFLNKWGIQRKGKMSCRECWWHHHFLPLFIHFSL